MYFRFIWLDLEAHFQYIQCLPINKCRGRRISTVVLNWWVRKLLFMGHRLIII